MMNNFTETVIASPPYPARYRTRTLNKDAVTASVARQSMQLEVMDCFTLFAMTGLFMKSDARQSTKSVGMDCHVAALLAMTAIWSRHCERSAAIHEVLRSWVSRSLTLLAVTVINAEERLP